MRDDDKHIWREASELGWRAGQFPASVTLDGLRYTREGFDRDSEGDIVAARYRAGVYRLSVFND